MIDYSKLEEKIGVKFQNQNLLMQAFTHRSYLNENRDAGLQHNERLEFLGDAVMELATTDYLYKNYPDKNEGELTSLRAALVNTQTISDVAFDLGFNDFLLLSRGESKDTGRARQYILANTFESVIGAIFLDQGYEVARYFIYKFLIERLETIIKNKSWIDAKSKLQELVQEHMSLTPTYKTVKEEGPDHDKKFTVALYYGKKEIAIGDGKSKQEAEQEVARKALEEFKK
ncbi:MAG TPA: ribonuclease III [Candidatus Paceibacterota bacterium]|nr:ribonuclease III [Candidatus Paceibacterota bacterium]HMP18803.1 ribonuclease III [Candidatus Paceibacterota bacterium]HMP85298.1 ribonuclease III [Candidatus Paceibacterota bacterium]